MYDKRMTVGHFDDTGCSFTHPQRNNSARRYNFGIIERFHRFDGSVAGDHFGYCADFRIALFRIDTGRAYRDE